MPPELPALRSRPRWMRFVVVGGIGFLVDSSLLAALVGIIGWGPLTSRLVSFGCAVFITWRLNRQFTFNDYLNDYSATEFQRYFVVNALGFALNYGVYAAFIVMFSTLTQYPFVAVVPSSIFAAIFNYWANVHFVFNSHVKAREDLA